MSLHNPTLKPQSTGPALPWRRANVRHTSNEIYVDVIEELFVTLAPSGRPLSAFANGAIAFNSKLSGVPDISLILSTPGGRSGIEGALSLPVFHPCVRLARWRDSPGELSFVPPDGRFVLAGYEVDLLPPPSKGPKFSSNIQLPVFVEVRIGLGSLGSEFEVRLSISTPVSGSATPTSSYAGRGGFGSRLGTSSPAFSGSTNIPLITGILVSIPLPDGVRNITDIRPTRGEAQYLPSESKVEWRVSPKEIRTGKTVAGSTLRCTVTGHFTGPGEDIAMAKSTTTEEYDYKEDGYQQGQMKTEGSKAVEQSEELGDLQNQRYAMLMPSSVNVSFSVKGWLASGLRVDSLSINASASRGLGEGVKPYKGLKYLTVSRNGLEVRC
jgi:AP-3 complex subunit mu